MKHSTRVGFFLALRSIRRANLAVSVLIVMILTLIFLNLVAVGGLLLGLIKGSELDFIKNYSGTVLVEPLVDEQYIQFPNDLLAFTQTVPGYISHSMRIVSGATLEIGWKDKQLGGEVSNISASLTGLDPEGEERTTNLSDAVIEGRWLEPGDRDKIVLGAVLAGRGPSLAIGEALEDVHVGDTVRATYGTGARREYEVVGIVEAKPALLNIKAYVTRDELQDILGHSELKPNEIAILFKNPLVTDDILRLYQDNGYMRYNNVSSFADVLGSAISDVNDTFTIIGNVVGGIGLMVGGITIFILTFVNAVSKRRFIGILRASGITSSSIIISYVIQGLFYSLIAVGIGLAIVYGFLVPYFDANPIDFPFSDGIIYVTPDYVAFRAGILLAVSIISGWVPARLITRENILNAILQR